MNNYTCRDCGHKWEETESDYFDRECECPECGSVEIDEEVNREY